MTDKDIIRKQILSKRNSITYEEAVAKSLKITDKLILTDEFKNSSTIMIYMDFKNEVKTMSLIRRMLSEGKRVIIPYTDIKNTIIIPVEINDFENDLALCRFGYLEPKKEKIIPVDVTEIDMIIVPGVVFDVECNRIGFGKGYYDRILINRREDVKAIAIAYEFQVLEQIPYEKHDIKMDKIITESNIYVKTEKYD